MIFSAISIQQPWAWAILHAGKDVENRTWAIPRRFTGICVLIHAGKKIDREAIFHLQRRGYKVPEHLETGGIVGKTRFIGSLAREPRSPWAEMGLHHWLMNLSVTAPVMFFHCKGRLGFFNVDYPYEVSR